jgi:hypothetical protein
MRPEVPSDRSSVGADAEAARDDLEVEKQARLLTGLAEAAVAGDAVTVGVTTDVELACEAFATAAALGALRSAQVMGLLRLPGNLKPGPPRPEQQPSEPRREKPEHGGGQSRGRVVAHR